MIGRRYFDVIAEIMAPAQSHKQEMLGVQVLTPTHAPGGGSGGGHILLSIVFHTPRHSQGVVLFSFHGVL